MSQGVLPPVAPGIADSSFYGMLAGEDRARLGERTALRSYRQGYMLMMENERSSHLMVLLVGWAKATSVTAGGEEVVLRIYGPGDLLGAEAALGSQPRSETVTALTSCTALVLSVRRFADLVAENSGIARVFNLAMIQRIQAADEQIKLRHAPAHIRLARVLMDLASRAGTQTAGSMAIPVDLTQEDLASWLGTSRSTVARVFQSLRARALIRTSYRNITIIDPEELRQIADSAW
jgi:CRP/FNR family transcriptional regulator, cyclic AMP receptor protein